MVGVEVGVGGEPVGRGVRVMGGTCATADEPQIKARRRCSGRDAPDGKTLPSSCVISRCFEGRENSTAVYEDEDGIGRLNRG